MSKHTPGPWHIVSGLKAVFPDGTMREVPVFYIEQEGRLAGENCVAGLISRTGDAALIAAAPDLLAIVKDCYAYLAGDNCGPLTGRMKAAITKAERNLP